MNMLVKVTITPVVGTKNDGLIQPEAARWGTRDAWLPETPQQMYSENNYYYGDDPSIFPTVAGTTLR
ncbi:MAG: hypothetical protein K9N34_04010 [Candidatus Marinimicrobia bacterium]|nr:hypothetical protein [Candidatus Neomarinimicrobiota bacterium]MCF7839813.1 hypothetical protein [Candidatus Neomarinimicrobiota bacterium]